MQGIQIQITSCRSENRASGTVTVGGVVTFRCMAEYSPRSTGNGLAYPWVTYICNRENIPQRFITFEGALSEVKALTMRQFDLEAQEQMRSRTTEELDRMVEEIMG